MRRVSIIIALMFALAIVPTAFSHYGAPYWTEDHASYALFNSTWAEDHNVTDVNCEGQERPRVTADGDTMFKHFLCDIELISMWGSLHPIEMTCYAKARLHVLSSSKFVLTDKRGFDDNCY